MGYIISVFTNKGGVAKTTTTLSLGHALSKLGVKTLVADVDSQCNCTDPLVGLDPQNNLMDVLNGVLDIEKCIRPIGFQKGLFCLPNTSALGTIEPKLIRMGAPGFLVLRDKIQDHCRNNFDVTIIDCPPNHGIMTINALIASDLAIVPTEAGSRNSINGLLAALEFIDDIKNEANSNLKFFKLLVTKLDSRTSIGKDSLLQLKDLFPDKIFDTFIPVNVDFQYAENQRKTIFQSNSKASGAKAYLAIAKEIIQLLEIK